MKLTKKETKAKTKTKGALSKRSIYLLFGIGVMIMIGVIWYIYDYTHENIIPRNLTKETLKTKVIEEIRKYEYSDVQMRTLIELNGEEQVMELSTYSMSTKEDSHKSFIVMDKNLNITDTLVWERNDYGSYDLYLLDVRNDITVKTEQETEPLSLDPWGIVNNVDDYTLHDEVVSYGNIDCYLLYIFGNNEDGNLIGEELYIDTKTYLPVGLVCYTQVENGDKIVEDIVGEYGDQFGDDITIEDVQTTVSSMSEYTLVYTFQYSNGESQLVGIPTTYLTEDEYVTYINSLQEDSEDVNEEE